MPPLLIALGCAHARPLAGRDVRLAAERGEKPGSSVTQLEMQQEIQRFTSAFLDRLVDALNPILENSNRDLRREAARRALVYASSALEIATGPLPEVDVLDMVVFLRLSRSVIERHWLPQVFGEPARPLLAEFTETEARAWALAGKVLTDEQRDALARLIDVWERDNPDSIRVEMVRFQEFSARSGTLAKEERQEAAGLLGGVQSATRAADHALLLGERGLFLTHRLPFLLRLQARLGVQEVTDDSLRGLRELDLKEESAQAEALIRELSRLAGESKQAAIEARRTIDAMRPLLSVPPVHPDWQRSLETTNHLAETSLSVLRELRGLGEAQGHQTLDRLEERVDRLMKKLFGYGALLGAAWAACFSFGLYFARRGAHESKAAVPPPSAPKGSFPTAPTASR